MNKDSKIKEVKKEMENLKKDFDKNYKTLEVKLAKLEKGDYEVGDEIKWCGFDWIVIKIIKKDNLEQIDTNYNEIGFFFDEKEIVTLMLKNTIKEMKYSDNNSNDYNESNIKKYLENKFIEKLDKDKLEGMQVNYDEFKYAHTKIRIPTLREIESLPMNIRKSDNYYWTMTASYGVSEDCDYARVFIVNSDGYLYWHSVNAAYGLRPIITLSIDNLEKSDKYDC